MSDVTRILSALEHGEVHAAEKLLPLVYEELRKLAAQKLAQERPGHTLQATALVHEAYLRLVGRRDDERSAVVDGALAGGAGPHTFASSRHFFLAAAEAMRRILVDNARKKKSRKRGGDLKRVDLFEDRLITEAPEEQLMALDDALAQFGKEQPRMTELVKLRFFAGLTLEQTAEALGISLRTAKRDWTFARAWLRRDMDRGK
jgi:RNA polymerase sigma factor (sigma-70 family)